MPTVVFDALGTLFSMDSPRRALASIGAPPHALDLWFAQSLRDFFGLSHASNYVPLAKVLEPALNRVLGSLELDTEEDATTHVMESLNQLTLSKGARSAVQRFRDAGWTTIVLTNGERAQTKSLLQRNEIDHLIDHVRSCDELEISKPNAAPYEAIEDLGESPRWMVAAHGWDVMGASKAGFATAWVSSLEQEYLSAFPKPDAVGADLGEVAERILGNLNS